MHRFFVMSEDIKDNFVDIKGEQARHLNRVLRLKVNDTIVVFDGSGYEYEAVISRIDRDAVTAQIVKGEDINREAAVALNLVQGIARGDKMDTIIQKAVEIGVRRIYPLISDYTVVTLKGDRAAKKVERWQQIAVEACKQSRRNHIPEVLPPLEFKNFFAMVNDKPGIIIMLYESEDEQGLKQVLQQLSNQIMNTEVFLLVGPEGGFSAEEAALARAQGVWTAGLGPRILRTETAAIVGSSLILYECGDLG